MKVGVSLSGGAARGMLHVGVIEELHKHKIPIDIIAGCSVGAILAAIYAVNADPVELRKRVVDFLEETKGRIIPVEYIEKQEQEERRNILSRMATSLKRSVYYGVSLASLAYFPSSKLREIISSLLPDIDITDLKVPFACSATNLTDGSAQIFKDGSLIDAVTASSSLPGLYEPSRISDSLLVDGAWASPNMVTGLREMGAGFVVASNIQQMEPNPELASGFDMILRSDMVARHRLSELQLRAADVVIQPDLCHVGWWDFSRSLECEYAGQENTHEHMKEIKHKLRRAKLRKFFMID